MPSYGGLVEPSGPKLTLKNLRLVLKILYAGCLGLPAVISAQFALEMCVAAWNREKFTKTPILGVQSSSGSSMLVSWQEHVDYLHKKLRTFTNIFYKIQSRPKLKSDILKPFFFAFFIHICFTELKFVAILAAVILINYRKTKQQDSQNTAEYGVAMYTSECMYAERDHSAAWSVIVSRLSVTTPSYSTR